MAQSVLSVRMDSDTKAAFAAFCEEAGMSVSTAINVFAKQVVREQRLPFVISVAERPARVLTVTDVAQAVEVTVPKYPAISAVVLFGSYARGEATPESDIDLRIEYDADAGFSLLDLSSFVAELRELTGKDVDAVTKRALAADFAAEIARDGVVLYERAQ